MAHQGSRKPTPFISSIVRRGRLENWTTGEIKAARDRMKQVAEQLEARRLTLEAELVNALPALQITKCMDCNLMPIDDEIGICQRCAQACGHEAAEHIKSLGRFYPWSKLISNHPSKTKNRSCA